MCRSGDRSVGYRKVGRLGRISSARPDFAVFGRAGVGQSALEEDLSRKRYTGDIFQMYTRKFVEFDCYLHPVYD